MFSVAIAAYNAETTIGAAVRSAFAQTLPPAEVIVADDCSTDATARIAAECGATVVRRDRNGGEAAAKNTAVAHASSEWVALLDADDTYAPGRLAAIAEHVDRADIISTDAWVTLDGRPLRPYYGDPHGVRWAEGDPRTEILARNFILSASAVRRELWLDAGGMDETDRTFAADWPLWVRLVLGGASPVLVDEPLYRYSLVSGSLSDSTGFVLRTRRAAMFAALDAPTASAEERRLAHEYLRDADRQLDLHHARRALWEGHRPRRAYLRIAANGGYRKRHRAEAALAAVAPGYARSRMPGNPEVMPRR